MEKERFSFFLNNNNNEQQTNPDICSWLCFAKIRIYWTERVQLARAR